MHIGKNILGVLPLLIREEIGDMELIITPKKEKELP